MEGQDKGWVKHLGKPLVQHAISIISPQVSELVVSINRNESRYRELGIACSMDEQMEYAGPLMGIWSARKLINTEFIFVMPCDMPGLPGDVVERLYENIRSHEICVARDETRLQPLVFIARTQVIDSIELYLGKTEKSVKGWIKSRDYHAISFPGQQQAFQNINTTSQLQR